MAGPVTLFTGQGAYLSFEEICKKAIVVALHSCSISMPTMDEVAAFARGEAFHVL